MPSTSSSSRNWTVFRFISAYMILLFLWRVFVPAHEYSMRTAQILDIAINILLLVGLVGLKRQLDREFEPDDSRWASARPLYWGGLIAGVLMLLIRSHEQRCMVDRPLAVQPRLARPCRRRPEANARRATSGGPFTRRCSPRRSQRSHRCPRGFPACQIDRDAGDSSVRPMRPSG